MTAAGGSTLTVPCRLAGRSHVRLGVVLSSEALYLEPVFHFPHPLRAWVRLAWTDLRGVDIDAHHRSRLVTFHPEHGAIATVIGHKGRVVERGSAHDLAIFDKTFVFRDEALVHQLQQCARTLLASVPSH